MSRNYKFNNPKVAYFIFRKEDYLYSSAIDYSGEKGLIDDIVVVSEF